jgi:hypothetical protein
MGILAKCPSCGMVSDEVRCPRCNALKVVGCSGSCALCGSDSCAPAPGADKATGEPKSTAAPSEG